MKHIIGLLGGAIVALSPNVAFAVSCTALNYAELVQRLEEVKFPLMLLDKVHVDDQELRIQESFSDCPPNSSEGETAFIYSWRPIEGRTRGLGVSFTFFDFPSAEA